MGEDMAKSAYDLMQYYENQWPVAVSGQPKYPSDDHIQYNQLKNFNHSQQAYEAIYKKYHGNTALLMEGLNEAFPQFWTPPVPPLPSNYKFWHGLYLPQHVIGILTPKPKVMIWDVSPKAQQPYASRGVESQLYDLFPAIRNYEVRTCPAEIECDHCRGECACQYDPNFGCGECADDCESCDWGGLDLSHCIQHLNDEHVWSREQIADWLETLDVDLTMSATEKGN